MLRKMEAIAITALAVTAIVSIGVINASTEAPNVTEPKETVCETTTAPIVTETIEVTQEPTEETHPVTEVTEPLETEATVPTETEPKVIGYDVPLSEDLQLYIISLCEGKNIDPAIVFAMIWRESRFNPLSVGDNGNSLGLMQIQPRWHSGLMAEFGCDDLLDPYQNVTIGIAILAGHVNYYDGNVEMGVMAYNAGKAGAYNAYFSKGVYSSPYSREVLEKSEELRSTAITL